MPDKIKLDTIIYKQFAKYIPLQEMSGPATHMAHSWPQA